MGIISPGKNCSVPFDYIRQGFVYLRPVTHLETNNPQNNVGCDGSGNKNSDNNQENGKKELEEKATYKRNIKSTANKNVKWIDESTQHIEYDWSLEGIQLQSLRSCKFHLSSPAKNNDNMDQYLQQSHQENTFYYTIWVEKDDAT